nr:transposase (putative), gypsy type [Tanacetum cinerariifolium]
MALLGIASVANRSVRRVRESLLEALASMCVLILPCLFDCTVWVKRKGKGWWNKRYVFKHISRDMDTDLYPHMLTAIAGRRWVLGHGIRLAMMRFAQSSECSSSLGNVISLTINKGIQQGLVARIEHGKVGRSLAQVEAYDPEVKNKYVVFVREFKNVSFSLLEDLEALKDSPLALIMSTLTLEGDADSTPELRRFRPSLNQVTILVYSKSDGSRGSSSISHEMLLSDATPAIYGHAKQMGLGSSSGSTVGGATGNVYALDSSLAFVDYHISTRSLTNDTVFVTQPHDDLFNTIILDKPVDP